MGNEESLRRQLKDSIEKEVFVTKDQERMVNPDGTESSWLFDFRRVTLEPRFLDAFCEVFWETFESEHPFQVGGIEVAAIPFISAIVMKSVQKGRPVNGFFIRKSRKKQGLMHMIEGKVGGEKIILVDDLMNSGKSFIRQVEVLESLGKKVSTVFSILRFRDMSYYTYFHKKGIRVISLFELDDFKGALAVKNMVDKKREPPAIPFVPQWYWKAEKPNLFYVVPKSAPIIDDERIYFGSDNGNFWALNQLDGSIAWNYRIVFGSRGKYIFSSPTLYKDLVYFGAYDGNLYALNKHTGKKQWICMEADWIGSSPAVASNLGLLYVGLEFGLINKHGGLVALDATTGKKIWEYSMPGLTHGSPAYSQKNGMVLCGSNDFSMYALDAKTGKRIWEYKTGGEIKASIAFDEKERFAAFGSHDKVLYIVEVRTGNVLHRIETQEAIYSTPLIVGDTVCVASLDKTVYAFSITTGKRIWKFETSGRIFASPKEIGGNIYIGSNDGRLYELDVATGKNTAFAQVTERITNAIAYNPTTQRFFLPTFANEIYCFRRGGEGE